MNIEEFFELSAGKWFSHRTNHNFALKQSEDGKSEIIIETLPVTHLEVVKLCQRYKIAPSSASCAMKVTWNSTTEGQKDKISGSSVLVSVPDADNPAKGKLLRQTVHSETPVAGHYKIDNDDALTITTEYENMRSQERLWFASSNLRMGVVHKQFGNSGMASFTSEIRMGGSPAVKASQAANSASS
ncbi:MAG: phycobiliprotein lyase [Desmonostoc vinosum HA7617-LM4]|jgi:hypothetical protein|nr:phycobiliprotein lyase [Desmonostoc vinosum HA7617-LM4]